MVQVSVNRSMFLPASLGHWSNTSENPPGHWSSPKIVGWTRIVPYASSRLQDGPDAGSTDLERHGVAGTQPVDCNQALPPDNRGRLRTRRIIRIQPSQYLPLAVSKEKPLGKSLDHWVSPSGSVTRPGFEPGQTESKSVVLTITLSGSRLADTIDP